MLCRLQCRTESKCSELGLQCLIIRETLMLVKLKTEDRGGKMGRLGNKLVRSQTGQVELTTQTFFSLKNFFLINN
ncbi:hypothetical protein Hanom_Chr10g00917121 [Helianthus anomalus]